MIRPTGDPSEGGEMPRRGVDPLAKLALFDDPWSPRTIAEFNGHDVMVAKFDGEFVWHSHTDTDDFFLVLSGHIVIQLRDGDVELGPGEIFVVPAGVEHRPCALEPAEVLLVQPTGSPNTGDPATAAERTVL